ncbi:MAG: hypothetical protein ACD_65C00295G0005 [uncultured bacterium]|nr:MAG: hypothetical protein ACD_65C00295G0005 [uncultured bacterium]
MIFVVFSNTVDDFFGKIIFLEEFDTKFNMTPLFTGNNFANIMKQTTQAHNVDIGFDFGGKFHTNAGFFEGVTQHVLTITTTIFEVSQKRD